MGTKAGNFTVVRIIPPKLKMFTNWSLLMPVFLSSDLWKNATFLVKFKYCGYFWGGEVCTEIIVLESPSKKKSQETHITIVSSVLMSLQKEQKQFSEETYSCTELLTTIEKERKGRVAKEKKNEEKCGNGKAKKCSIPPGKIWTCYLVISFRTIHIY